VSKKVLSQRRNRLAAIQENLNESNYGELLAKRGVTPVALNRGR